MIENFAKTEVGFLVILIISSAVSWIATHFDEKLLLDEVNTITLMIYESLALLIVIVIIMLVSNSSRKTVMKNINRINIRTFSLLLAFSAIALGMGFAGDYILKHHGTSKVKIGQVIVSFIVTGLIYLVVERNSINIKKLLFFLTMLGGAIGFTMT